MNYRIQHLIFAKDLGKPSVQAILGVKMNHLPSNTEEERIINFCFAESKGLCYGSVAYDHKVQVKSRNEKILHEREDKRKNQIQ